MDVTNPALAYDETWYATSRIDAPARPPLGSEVDAEVCVIGGGLAGLTVAYELARRGWSVIVVEAGRIAGQASGRNTGFVLPGFAAEPDSVIARVGFDHAKDLWTLAQAGVDYVRHVIGQEQMPGVDPQDGWLHVSKTDNGDELMRVAALAGEFGGEIEGWPIDRVRAVLRSERYFHAIHYPRALSIHPLNYALGLAAAAERAGVRIYEDTPAVSLDPAGVRKRIATPHGRLRASYIVLCGNLEIAGLMPQITDTLVPITTYVAVTAKLGSALGDAIGYRGAISDTDLADSHYRVVDGDRLMWSGRATTWRADAKRYSRALAADIRKTYPQLGRVAVESVWSGTVGTPIHRMPQIGELGPGLWLASGFGGHGLNTTAMAGNLIARAIADDNPAWKMFAPFELVWAGGKYGRALTQGYYWLRRFGDAAGERRAQMGSSARRYRHLARQGMVAERSSFDVAPRVEPDDDLPSDTASPPTEIVAMHLETLPPAATLETMTLDNAEPQIVLSDSVDDHREGSEDGNS
jgi:glycine/D-amino acid oxidase-like deaminating enzyme